MELQTGSIDSAVAVALEISARETAQLRTIKKALSVSDEQAALMCMRRLVGLGECAGRTQHCCDRACPAYGMDGNDNESETA